MRMKSSNLQKKQFKTTDISKIDISPDNFTNSCANNS